MDTVFYSISFGPNTSLPLVVVWLVVASILLTLYFGFINVRGIKQGAKLIRGDYSDPNDTGEVSHFQALATALSGTVGLGNIAGVAVAISVGGPGATFWMIVAGLFGMSTKFCECTLGVRYRRENANGSISGGPMYYLRDGIASAHPGLKGVGKFLAVLFAICAIGGSLGGGNMFQANQVFQQMVNVTGGETGILAGRGWLFGLAMAVLVAFVIIGGIQSIAKVTSKLVPFMAIIYLVAGMAVILIHLDHVPAAFAEILSGAFSPDAAFGGFIGVLIWGFQRAAFSNEAGIGSAAIAHSAVKTKEPITEGLVALWEPFIDTVVICTMTALVIVISESYLPYVGLSSSEIQGVEVTSAAYAGVISWFPVVLALAVALFGFSTMLAWSYYGEKAACFLFGNSKAVSLGYKLVFCLFVVIGSAVNLGIVLTFSDAMIFAMSIPNVVGLYLLAPVVKRELQSYFARVKSGEIKSYRN
ncbi:MAG: alanine:cation symporter family protein [Xanthomonadales bacterium]|nr:alanine:cation symporter family protein [Xanthomonadales bacterium]